MADPTGRACELSGALPRSPLGDDVPQSPLEG